MCDNEKQSQYYPASAAPMMEIKKTKQSRPCHLLTFVMYVGVGAAKEEVRNIILASILLPPVRMSSKQLI